MRAIISLVRSSAKGSTATSGVKFNNRGRVGVLPGGPKKENGSLARVKRAGLY